MEFQLVIQLPESQCNDIDLIADIEDKLDDYLIDAEVDGHDIGSEEVNIFIHTNAPDATLKQVKYILEEERFDLSYVKIAYRKIGSEKYVPLWPENLIEFNVK
ncbi:MAG: hypothetical protein LEGION0403_FIIPPAGN_02738 [Legionella sp.]|uniref:hypothetical protein n=1 Tax=Legionella sp. TaxID=459 RepID=UPI003D0F5E55